MFSILKKLFSKSQATETEKPSFSPPATAATAARSGVPAASAPPVAPPSDGIAITLKACIPGMPDSIKTRLDKELTGSEIFHISRADAMRQLPTGAVKIPFSEIHRMVPNTFLTPDQEMLATQISLPLGEILPKIKALPRRANQKVIEIPDDIEGMFANKATSAKAKVVSPSTAPAGEPTIPKPPTPSVPKTPLPPTPPVPAAAAPAKAPAPVPPQKPAADYVPPQPKPLEPQPSISFKLESPAAPAAPKPTPPKPAPAPTPTPAPISMAPAPAPIAMAPKPAITPAPTAPVSAPAAAAATDQPTFSLGDVFGQPEKTDWTPQEVVQKTAALRGVAGAIIATSDGLAVAFQLPEHLNGNVIGAFVPQMYTRIAQYTRDLKLGDAKHLTIIVENTPLLMYKSGNIYFTALGKSGENLPKPQLTAIAAALGRQSQP